MGRVANSSYDTIGEYTTSGAAVNASLVSTGLYYPGGIAVSQSTPEPSTLALLCVGAMSFAAYAWRRKQTTSRPRFSGIFR